MPISRNTKTGGSTAVTAGQVFNAADINADMDTLFAKFDAGIVSADLSASAGITVGQLSISGAITSAMITDATIVAGDLSATAGVSFTQLDDISATDAAHDDTTTPGDSATHVLPTTGSGELQQIRYAVERLGLGVAASRYDATGTREAPFWGDLPARGMQRIPGINGVVSSGLPSGWTNVATATLAQEAADAADGLAGKGRAIKITAAGSANEGMSYTLSGLKESTRYFIAALLKATSGDTARLDCTGGDATSSFRNFTADVTATTWTWAYGIVQTDATPTSIVVRVLAASDTDVVWVADVQYGECAAPPISARVAVVEQRIAATAGTAIDGATTTAGFDTNYQVIDDGTLTLDLTVYVPGDGYYIKVTADLNGGQTAGSSGTNFIVTWRLYQSVAAAALAAARTRELKDPHDGGDSQTPFFADSLVYIVKNPTPGASYRFAIAATVSGAAQTLTPQKGSVGSSALTIEVLPYGG
jgi:hypothetical protein